ncbi:MAG TPA: class II fructose-bisphosphate aldolase [Fibrobacteria bacterium]|nr:class II fructose-bisphosphate aldolase [Fibrobacteria bacterium]
MPVATYQQYTRMFDEAKKGGYAYPAFNVTSTETANAVLQGLAESKSDGIIQVSTGGGEFASGNTIKDMALGGVTLAQHVHTVAGRYNILVGLHTDHCQADKLDKFVKPLIAETEKRRSAGLPNLFNSHMFDGSALPMDKNIAIAEELLKLCAKNEIILEIETGVVGGEEDGHDTSGVSNDKLYTSPADMELAYEKLAKIGRFLLAATFGNVHGVYKPGNVKLTPKILRDGQAEVQKTFKTGPNPLDLVFHGGSGSDISEIHETLTYGVVKMNVDTDTQYAFTRPIVDHMLKNYDGVLKIEGEVGNKKVYDPRSYLKAAEKGMAKRVQQAADDLKSTGKSLLS